MYFEVSFVGKLHVRSDLESSNTSCMLRSEPLRENRTRREVCTEYNISYNFLNEIMQNLMRWSIIDGYGQLGRMSGVVVPRRTSQ